MWLLFLWRNNGILAFLKKTRNMVFANLTYLDYSLNRYIVLCSYKALMDLCERRVVSTEPARVAEIQVAYGPYTLSFWKNSCKTDNNVA